MKKQDDSSGRYAHPAHRLFTAAGLTLGVFIALGALGVTAFYSRTILQSENFAAVISAVLVDLTNDDREDNGLHTLTVNPLLVAAAQAKADDMASKGYFAHNSPGGETPWYWIKQSGYSFSTAGENLAVNFSDSEDVERAWMNSPAHRENIVNGRFTEIGIATASGMYKGKKVTFVVQMFGTPSKSAIPTAPAVVVDIPTAPKPAPRPQVLGSETEVVTSAPAEEPVVTQAPASTPQAAPAPVPASTVVSISQPIADPMEPAAPVASSKKTYAPVWGHIATSPQAMLRAAYLFSGLIMLFALLLITRLEFRQHHFRHVAAAFMLTVFMGGLFTLADRYVFEDPVIAQAAELSGA